jgi:drug/metabolite transporter (DMT)-like permease
MLAAVLAWTAYTIVAKRFADADQVVVITYVSLVGTAMLLPFSIWELAHVSWRQPSVQAWLGILFLGVVASALAYVVYGWALRILDASVVGTLSNLDPIVGVLTGVIFLGEKMSAGQVIGGAVALVGMWLASHEQGQKSSAT